MATTTTKPAIEVGHGAAGVEVPSWPQERAASAPRQGALSTETSSENRGLGPSGRDALQALLAFSALHQQVRQRRALASRLKGFETIAPPAEFEGVEQFVLDEVLQLVAERAIAITGADGLGIALAENNEIVLRASAGTIKPDVGQRIQRDSAFSGACFRMAQIVRCDDSETDDRVNLSACRRLGARSMVAVPLCGRRRVIGVLEAFSIDPFGFNDSDVRSLELLAELILGALKPEDEDRFAQAAQVAATKLEAAPNMDVLDPSVANARVLDAPPAVLPDKPSAQHSAPAAHKIERDATDQKLVVADLHAKPAPDEKTSTAPSASSVIGEIVVAKTPELSKIAEPETAKPRSTEPKPAALQPLEPTIAKPNLAESPIAAATVSEPTLVGQTIAEPETAVEPRAATSNRRGVLLALVLVVVVVVVAGGIWLKLNNAQLGNSMVQSQKPELKPLVSEPAGSAAANQPLTASSSANPDTDAAFGPNS